MKKILVLLILVFFIASCAPLMKYEPPKISMDKALQKQKHYELPTDPFANVEPPKAIFLAKEGQLWKEVPKEQAELICYTAREHDKIVLRISYYKEIVPALVRLVNIQIDLNNAHVQLVVSEELAKEIYHQLFVDAMNKNITDSRWSSLEKGGLYAIILGLIINLGLAL